MTVPGPAWLALALLLVAAPFVSRLLCRLLGLVRPNFRGDVIPSSVGLTFLLVGAGVYASLAWRGSGGPMASSARLFLLVTVGFGLLGLADDLWGTRAVGGFRGHLRALLRGRPTTGGVKLVGGGVIALLAAWGLRGGGTSAAAAAANLPELGLDALLIALAANTLNLLDVRPGRALAGFALLALPTCALAALGQSLSGGGLLIVLVIAAAVEAVPDARGRAMMGDTGSNLLGATAGLAAAIALPVWGRALLLLALLFINAAAERVSLSRVIERTPWLAAIDRRLGVR